MPLDIIVGAVVGAAATGAVTSEKVRNKLRKGLVYSLAGVLVAYDKAVALTTNAMASARKMANDATATATAEHAPAANGEANGSAAPPPS